MIFFKGLFAKNVVKNTTNTKKELSLQSYYMEFKSKLLVLII